MNNDWIVATKSEPDKWGRLEAGYLVSYDEHTWPMTGTIAEAARMPLEEAKRLTAQITPVW